MEGTPLPRGGAGVSACPVANSADLGVWKADRRFWELLKRRFFAGQIRRVVLIDDFGFNEALEDDYGERTKIESRRMQTRTVLETVFQVEPRIIPFYLETAQVRVRMSAPGSSPKRRPCARSAFWRPCNDERKRLQTRDYLPVSLDLQGYRQRRGTGPRGHYGGPRRAAPCHHPLGNTKAAPTTADGTPSLSARRLDLYERLRRHGAVVMVL